MKFSTGDLVSCTHNQNVQGRVIEPNFQDKYVVFRDVKGVPHIYQQNEVVLLLQAPNFDDVGAFHGKFGLPNVHPFKTAWSREDGPVQLDQETFEYRLKFMQEELDEFQEAFLRGDYPNQ